MPRTASIAQHLLQFSPDALIVVDDEGIMLFANATTCSLFGYSREAMIGRSIEILVPERYRLRHGAHLSGYLRSPTNREMGARIIDLFARRADGSEFPAAIRLAPFNDGKYRYVAAAIRDVTERRAISDALIAAREEADRANMAKTRFLATASHDLRQPLQTIRLLNASLLTLTQTDAQVHDLVKRQESAISSASRLLNSLLDITRLESGAIEPQLGPAGLASIFADLRQEFEPEAEGKSLELNIAATSIVLHTDRMLLTQLLQNLVGNAVKYTLKGRIELMGQLDEGALLITVEDTGVGIPADKLERVFDEYYQVDPSGTPRSGVGLGLAIVREVSRLLSYSVAVTSQLGIGTRVQLRIPASCVCVGRSAPKAPEIQPLEPVASARCRILLLEDNDSVRTATELYLTLEGYETLAAGSTAEAERLLSALAPGDILISDFHLDGSLTGLDLLRQVRLSARRDVPAILLSGDLESMMRVVKTDIPNCRFLSKPVDTAALLSAIAELIGR